MNNDKRKIVGSLIFTFNGKRDGDAYCGIAMYYKPNWLCRFLLAKIFNIYWFDEIK